MPLLAIEGVTFPVKIDSASLRGETVGTNARNQRGHRVLNRRREKLVLEFVTTPKTLDEFMMYRMLALGEGEFWNTLAGSVYGAKGYPLTGTGTIETSGGGNPHNGNGTWKLDPTETLVVPGSFYDQTTISSAAAALFGSSLIAWRRDDSTGAYRVVGFSWRTYDTTATIKREALGTSGGLGTLGTPQAFTGGETFSVSGTSLTITAGAGGPFRYSNLRVFPWYLKADQLDALIAGRNRAMYTLPQLPMVYVQSDLFPLDNQKGSPTTIYDASLICHGEVDDNPIVPTMQGGTFTTTTGVVSGRLIEV